MSTAANLDLVRRCMDSLHAGDREPLLAALTDDAIVKATNVAGSPLAGHFEGRAGFLRYFAAIAATVQTLEMRVREYAVSETHVVTLGDQTLRVLRTGVVFTSEFACTFTLRAGKIARVVANAEMTPIADAYR